MVDDIDCKSEVFGVARRNGYNEFFQCHSEGRDADDISPPPCASDALWTLIGNGPVSGGRSMLGPVHTVGHLLYGCRIQHVNSPLESFRVSFRPVVQKTARNTEGPNMNIGLIALYDLDSFSIRTLHSVLKNNNIEVDSLFFKSENPNNTMDKPQESEIDSLIRFIDNKQYDVIGISVRSSILSLAEEIALRIKKLKNPPKIIFGGIQPTLNPLRCFGNADIIVVGEGEKPIVEICQKKPLNNILNIYFKNSNNIHKNPVGFVEENLDHIPFPDFSDENKYFFNNGRSMKLNSRNYRTTYSVMTSRGCPFSCTYCCNSALRNIYKGKYLRRRSVDNVIDELRLARKNFPNTLYIYFLDDVFTFDKAWIKDFAKKYKEFISLPFFCYVHPKMCDEETIALLKSIGLATTTMGVQTFSDRTRKYYQRLETNEGILKSTKILNKYNIHFSLDIIMDCPIENEDDMKTNLDWLLKIKPPFSVHTHTMTYFPNTVLTEDFVKRGLIHQNQVEDELEKGWVKWTPSLDLSRDKLNLLYDCLYFLAKHRFRNKSMIRKLQKSRYFRNNPDKLAKIIKLFSIDALSLNWNSKADRIRFFISRGILPLLKGDFKFISIRLKQLNDTDKPIA